MLLEKCPSKGFTMIELLMVIMLVAILGSVAITQYLDFRKEGKEAAAAQVAASLNTAIKLQFVQSTLRCNNTERLNPPPGLPTGQ
ncbi:MAG: type II secretion system protein [Bdellovibrionota bacterium]